MMLDDEVIVNKKRKEKPTPQEKPNENETVELIASPSITLPNFDYQTVTTELALPLSTHIISLTGDYDTTQVLVIKDNGSYVLVVLKKVHFADKGLFIGGCSSCCNLKSNFLLYLELSENFTSNQEDNYLGNCKHVRACLSEIIGKIDRCRWKPIISTKDAQDVLLSKCLLENNSNFFVSLEFCASVESSEGLTLFINKNNKWKCDTCSCVVHKCKHGQKHIFPAETRDTVETADNEETIVEKDIFQNKSNMLSNTSFSGKKIYLFLGLRETLKNSKNLGCVLINEMITF